MALVARLARECLNHRWPGSDEHDGPIASFGWSSRFGLAAQSEAHRFLRKSVASPDHAIRNRNPRIAAPATHSLHRAGQMPHNTGHMPDRGAAMLDEDRAHHAPSASDTPIDAVLAEGWLTPTELDAIVIPRKTLANRRKLGTLTPDQSDRFSRVARIIAIARETFGDDDKARHWLRRPTAPLGGEAPLHQLDTDHGVRAVESLLGRIAHGIAA
jgi:putative toxin-antitoxin system antitoxin component (TIGR02293 family)